MKKYYIRIQHIGIIICAITLSVFVNQRLWHQFAFAQNTDPTPSPDTEIKTQEEKIQDLKSRLATKVAEIRENQKNAASGTISKLSDETFTLVTKSTEFQVNFSEDDTAIEELVGSRLQDRALDDLADDTYATVYGLINEDAEEIDAQRIILKQHTVTVTGIVTEIDSKNFIFKVQTVDNELFTVDFEKATTALTWNGTDIEEAGFSDIAENDRVHIRATANKDKQEKRVSAKRILRLSDTLFETADTTQDEEPPASEK